MSKERFIEIETRLAYQEKTLHELSDVVFEQQKQLDRLEALAKGLLARIEEIATTMPAPASKDEKPPHY